MSKGCIIVGRDIRYVNSCSLLMKNVFTCLKQLKHIQYIAKYEYPLITRLPNSYLCTV